MQDLQVPRLTARIETNRLRRTAPNRQSEGQRCAEELYRTTARQGRQSGRSGGLRRRSDVTDASDPRSSLGRRELCGNSTAFCGVDEPELIAGHAVCLDGITATEQFA